MGRPWVDSLAGTRLKELIPRGGHIGIRFRFDPAADRDPPHRREQGRALGQVVQADDPRGREVVRDLSRGAAKGRPAGMKTSKFRAKRQELLADATFRAKVAREKVLMAELDLAAARQETGLTQEAVAAALGKSQENVSRIERQRDVRVSTLAQFVQAQGGELEINAVFGGRRISLMRPVGTATSEQRVRR